MINQDFFLALEELEKVKGISPEVFISTLETALVSAYKKASGDASGISVKLNPEKKTIKVYSVKNVVAEVVDPEKEISVEFGRKGDFEVYLLDKEHDGEFIKTYRCPLSYAFELFEKGIINDANSVIALLKLNKYMKENNICLTQE